MKLNLALAGALLAAGLATPSIAAPFAQPAPFNHPAAYQYNQNNNHGGWRQPQRPAQWQLIGQRDVSPRSERDLIPAFGRARFQEVMLCVYRQPIRLADFDVKFANGGSQDVSVRNVIGAGQCTRAIDLKGQARDIKAVSLAYKAIGFGRGAQVKVFAR